MKKAIFYFRSFFLSSFILLMSSFSLVYIFALFENKNKEDLILNSQYFNFSDFFFQIKQNLLVFIVFTLIMIGLFLLFYLKRNKIEDKKSEKVIYLIIAETWITIVLIFFYIAKGMQGLRFNVMLASILTLATIFMLANYFFTTQNKNTLRKKIYALIFIFVTFLIHWIKSGNSYYTLFDLIVQTLSFYLLILLVYGFYLIIDSLFSFSKNIFIKFSLIFLLIFFYALAIILFVVLIYAIFYLVITLFSGFHFRGMFNNPFFVYLMALFKDSFNKLFTVYSYSDYLNPFLVILAIVFLIKDREKEATTLNNAEKIDQDDELKKAEKSDSDTNFRKIRNHRLIAEWIMVIIGIWSLKLFFVPGTTNETKYHFKNIYSFKSNAKEFFLDSEYVYVFVNSSKQKNQKTEILKFNNKGNYLSKHKIINFEDFIYLKKNKELVLFNNFPKQRKFDIYLYNLSENKISKKKSFEYSKCEIENGKKLHLIRIAGLQNNELFLLSNEKTFVWFDANAEIYWKQNLSLDSSLDYNFEMNNKNSRFKISNDSVFAYSKIKNKIFLFDLKNKKYSIFNDFYQAKVFPCLKFDTIENIDSTFTVTYYNSLNESKIIVDSLFVNKYVMADSDIVFGNDDSLYIACNSEDIHTLNIPSNRFLKVFGRNITSVETFDAYNLSGKISDYDFYFYNENSNEILTQRFNNKHLIDYYFKNGIFYGLNNSTLYVYDFN